MNILSRYLLKGAHRLSAWFGEGGSGGYRAATVSRLTDDWYPANLSADQLLKGDLRLLRARARQMERDNPNAAGYIQSLKDNVVGGDWGGIGLQARNRSKLNPKEFDGKLNAYLEERWEAWGYPEVCSADGRDSWGDLQRLYVARLAVDGEVLYRFLPGFDNEFGLAIEFLDIDQLDESLNRPANGRENEIRMGVEVDPHNRALAYWIWRHHPSDFGKTRERIRVPASDLYHDFIKLRPGQTRGVPWFTPAIFGWRMLDGYTQAEITQARIAAARGGFFEATGEDAELWNVLLPSGPNDKKEPLVMDMEPGVARQLPPGLTYNDGTPAHPNGNYGDFEKTINRQIARSLGPSYTSFSGNFENTSYSSGRMGLLPERDFYRGVARWVTVRFHRNVYAAWLKQALISGALNLSIADPSIVEAHVWQYRGWAWVDPLNDMQASEMGVHLGVATRTQICAERGLDFEDLVDQLAEEQRYAESKGVWIGGAGGTERIKVESPDPERPQGAQPKPPAKKNGNGAHSRLDLVSLETR